MNKASVRVSRLALQAELARRDFPEFAAMIHPRLSLEGFHRNYYRVLELFARGKIRRLIVSMPPQHGKSLASSVLLPAWLLGLNPDQRIAIASYNAKLAARFNRQVRSVLSSEKYAAVFPVSAIRKGVRATLTDEQLDIAGHAGGTFAVGREGTLTGNSVDLFVLDDLYKDAMEASSPVVRGNCWEWYTSVVRTRLHNDSQELIVFTRWHEEDLIGRIAQIEPVVPLRSWDQIGRLGAGEWLHLNLEALKESPPTEIDPRISGQALWPERHSVELLCSKRNLDAGRFAALYQGRPVPDEGYLYGAGLKTYDELPTDIVTRGNYTDTADTGEDFLCSICYAVGRDGLVYVTDVLYSQEPMEVTEGLTAEMLKRNGTRLSHIEGNNGGRGFARAVAGLVPEAEVQTFHQGANKEARIRSQAPAVRQLVRLPRGWQMRWPEWAAHITTYCARYAANRWHDGADALTGVVEKYTAPQRKAIKRVGFRN